MQGNKYHDRLEAKFAEISQIRTISEGWNELAHKKHLKQLSIKYHDNDIKLGKIIGTIPAPFEKAEKYYFECFEAQKKCRDMCDEFKCLETVDNDTNVVLFRTKSKFVVSAREMVSAQSRRKISATETAIFRVNLEEGHPNAPVHKDVVRGEGIIYGIFLKKVSDTETAVEAYFLINPKGSVPTSIVNSMVEQQLQCFENDIEAINKM